VAEKKGASGCDAGPVEANSKKLRASYGAFASELQCSLDALRVRRLTRFGLPCALAAAVAELAFRP